MVYSGRLWYEGTYEEWEEYLERAAARSRERRLLMEEEERTIQEEMDRGDLEQI